MCETLDKKERRIFNLSVSIDKIQSFFTLEEFSADRAPIQIQNLTDNFDLVVHQMGVNDGAVRIKSYEQVAYGWMEPHGENRLIIRLAVENELSTEINISPNSLDTLRTIPFVLFGQQSKICYSISIVQGTRIIRFYLDKDESATTYEAPSNTLITGNLKSIGISLISSKHEHRHEIAYINISTPLFLLSIEEEYYFTQIKVKDIKIDNNIIQHSNYPSLLYSGEFLDDPYIDFKLRVQKKPKTSNVSIKSIFVTNRSFILRK